MKLVRLVGFGALAVSVGLLVGACSPSPGIEVLEKPVDRVAGDVWGPRYTKSTRAALRQVGFKKNANGDPDAAIRALDARLNETNDPGIRRGAAELAFSEAFRSSDKEPKKTIGYLLVSIKLSEGGLDLPSSPDRDGLMAVYNEANAELVWMLHQQALGPGKRLSVATPRGERQIQWSANASGTGDPRFYDTLMPRSRMKVKGFEDINQRPGVGGVLVGYRKATDERRRADPFMPQTGYAVPVSSVVRWRSGRGAEVVLLDGMVEERVKVAGKTYPLAADYTAAVATAVNGSSGGKVGFAGMIHPNEAKDEEGLFILEPYRSDRIPLVLVHGLMSTPDTWRVVVNACYADPVIRKNYQILLFFYPTGYSIAQNAATLRERLKSFQRTYDPQRSNSKMRRMVMVGHSMGCNLTNFQIRDGGDRLWDTFFDKPVDQITDDSALRSAALRGAYFKANPDIKRAIFICGPHQGSPLSNSWLGRFGARLIGYPVKGLNSVSGNALASATPDGTAFLSEADSSINNLEVNSPLLEAIMRQPMPHRPVLHSIIGDRGKGGGVDSSDGVVPYWSSRLDYTKSEYFIPASHTQATKNPQNAREVRRILRLHVGEGPPATAP